MESLISFLGKSGRNAQKKPLWFALDKSTRFYIIHQTCNDACQQRATERLKQRNASSVFLLFG